MAKVEDSNIIDELDLDFEADEEESNRKNLEDGEVVDDSSSHNAYDIQNGKKSFQQQPVCRFFSRGHCTWGNSCRFVHPGLSNSNTGCYSMFSSSTSEDVLSEVGLHEKKEKDVSLTGKDYLNDAMTSSYSAKEDESCTVPHLSRVESAWEVGLKHAKEMRKRSRMRKVMDCEEYEEKRTTMSLTQAEIEKENDYYGDSYSPKRLNQSNEDFLEGDYNPTSHDSPSKYSHSWANPHKNMYRRYSMSGSNTNPPTTSPNAPFDNMCFDSYSGAKNDSMNGDVVIHEEDKRQRVTSHSAHFNWVDKKGISLDDVKKGNNQIVVLDGNVRNGRISSSSSTTNSSSSSFSSSSSSSSHSSSPSSSSSSSFTHDKRRRRGREKKKKDKISHSKRRDISSSSSSSSTSIERYSEKRKTTKGRGKASPINHNMVINKKKEDILVGGEKDHRSQSKKTCEANDIHEKTYINRGVNSNYDMCDSSSIATSQQSKSRPYPVCSETEDGRTMRVQNCDDQSSVSEPRKHFSMTIKSKRPLNITSSKSQIPTLDTDRKGENHIEKSVPASMKNENDTKKKSTMERRQDLLRQLKAVENAIAKKRVRTS